MQLIDILSAVVVVDFVTVALSKFFNLGKSLDKWYAKFGMTAVLSDCLVIVLGIQLALLIEPKAAWFHLMLMALAIQIFHDIWFYFAVIQTVPTGRNEIIDLFKEYATENSWKIVVADSIMVVSTVGLAELMSKVDQPTVSFVGLLATYALTYIIYTH
jgi:uncharacterized protein YacL